MMLNAILPILIMNDTIYRVWVDEIIKLYPKFFSILTTHTLQRLLLLDPKYLIISAIIQYKFKIVAYIVRAFNFKDTIEWISDIVMPETYVSTNHQFLCCNMRIPDQKVFEDLIPKGVVDFT